MTVFETITSGPFSRKRPYLPGKIGQTGAPFHREDETRKADFTGKMGPGTPNEGGAQNFMTLVNMDDSRQHAIEDVTKPGTQIHYCPVCN